MNKRELRGPRAAQLARFPARHTTISQQLSVGITRAFRHPSHVFSVHARIRLGPLGCRDPLHGF